LRKRVFLILTVFSIQSCGIDLDVLEYSQKNTSIVLFFPENEMECTEGNVISDTESELTFEWKDANFNSPYILHLTNISNGQAKMIESETTELAIILDRGISYSWYVTGTSNASSEIWNFFNAGPGLESAIPLPAEAISPVSGASISQTSTSVNLIWKSEDSDGDIVGHDLYFGESTDPEIYSTDITETRINEIPVKAGKTYYWKIVTKDSIGNESTSAIFSFSVG
jgi:hypothetical protein